MLKFTEKEVRDHIRRYGIERAGDTLNGVAKEMAAEQFAIMTQQKTPAFELPNGDVLYVSYNKESDMIDVGPVTNCLLYTADSYLSKLVRAGARVAISDMEEQETHRGFHR